MYAVNFDRILRDTLDEIFKYLQGVNKEFPNIKAIRSSIENINELEDSFGQLIYARSLVGSAYSG